MNKADLESLYDDIRVNVTTQSGPSTDLRDDLAGAGSGNLSVCAGDRDKDHQ